MRDARSRLLLLGLLLVLIGVAALVRSSSGPPRANRGSTGNAADPVSTPPCEQEGGEGAAAAPESRLKVRDLADGTPVANLTLVLDLTKKKIERTSNGNGEVVLLENEVAVLKGIGAGGDGWSAVGANPPLILEEGELWVYRTFELRGTVRGSGAAVLDPKAVRLEVVLDRIGAQEASAFPCTRVWLRRHRNRIRLSWTDRVDEHGAFELTLPRIRGITVRALAKGWRPAHATPHIDSKTNSAAVELVMKRGFEVAGVLRDAAGNPLKNVQVSAYVIRRTRFDELDIERVALDFERGGGTAMRSATRNYGRSTVRYAARTDEQGRFDIDVRFDGDIWLIARPAGLGTARHHLGPTSQTVRDASFTAPRPASTQPLRILVKGKPLANASLAISNLDIEDVQPAFTTRTDKTGRIATNWLEPGTRYALVVLGGSLGGGARALVWKGQEQIDLAELDPVNKRQ